MATTKEKTPVEIEREKINVTSSTPIGGEVENEDEENNEEENDDDNTVDKDNKTEEKEKVVEDNKEKIEASEKTEEELEAEKEAATTQAAKDKIQKRIDREVSKRKLVEKENKELKEKLAAKEADDDGKMTKAEAEALAEKIASNTVARNEFIKETNKLADAAEKLEKGTIDRLNEVGENVGPLPPVMIGILSDLDHGANLLAKLSSDEDEYERIINLSPAKMAVELSKLDIKIGIEIAEKSKTPPKKISKTPAPNEPLGGNATPSSEITAADDKLDEAAWIKKREKQLADRRAAR